MKRNAEQQTLDDAWKAIEVALNHLNYADQDFIDAAIWEYNAALAKFNALYVRAKTA